jgi:hypothetical protein
VLWHANVYGQNGYAYGQDGASHADAHAQWDADAQ